MSDISGFSRFPKTQSQKPKQVEPIVYFYVECYDAKKHNLLEQLPDFESEIRVAQFKWRSDNVARFINNCNSPRDGEDCFYFDYNMRFKMQCHNLDNVVAALCKLHNLQQQLSSFKVHSKIIIESDA